MRMVELKFLKKFLIVSVLFLLQVRRDVTRQTPSPMAMDASSTSKRDAPAKERKQLLKAF
jgi:hypothetical protein